MISYKKLWILLANLGMSKRDLMLKIKVSPGVMTKLRRNEEVSMTVLTKICETLGVSYGDIVEYIQKS